MVAQPLAHYGLVGRPPLRPPYRAASSSILPAGALITSCTNRSNPPGVKIANNRPGLLDKLRQACGTPLGTATLVPGATSNILSSTATLYVPSRTTKCSSSF